MNDLVKKFSEWANVCADWVSFGDTGLHDFIWAMVVLLLLAITALVAWFVSRNMFRLISKYLLPRTKKKWDGYLLKRRFFRGIGHLIPAIIIHEQIDFCFKEFLLLAPFIKVVAQLYIVLTCTVVLSTLSDVIGDIIVEKERWRDKPVRSYVQLTKIILWVLSVVFILAALIGRSPLVVIGSFGAATAILLIIFRDPLLGFVASVHMSLADLVRVGDWITVDKYGADGDVVEINLTTIKVQNWDMTLTIVPSYSLISESFRNWRGMQDSSGRRIKRHINVNLQSVKFCDTNLFDRLLTMDLIRPYLLEKRAEISQFNQERGIDQSNLANGRHLTNLGIFRIYTQRYLESHPLINPEMTYMVRQLQPTEFGVPMEVYAFSKEKKWEGYEKVISDIFDHLFAVLHQFDLEIHQVPSGKDWARFKEDTR